MIETDEAEYTPMILAAATPGPAEQTERDDLIRKVQQILLQGLTAKQRTALMSLVVRGFSPEQIAATMDMKTNAVYKLLHDGRLRLRQLLAKEGLSPETILEAFESS